MTKKKPSAGDRRVLAQVNTTAVTYEDLALLFKETAKLDHTKTKPGVGLYVCIRLFAKQPEKAHAVIFRMEALAHLLERGRLPGWTQRNPGDAFTMVHSALIAAAAEQPLILKGNRLEFERKSFLLRAFQFAKEEEHRS
jgi:hypothetical protein